MKFKELLIRSGFYAESDGPEIDEISKAMSERKLKKGEYLLHEGDMNTNIYFLEKGYCRVFTDRNDKEVNTWFLSKQDFILCINCYYLNAPSKEYIQAMEDCRLIYIERAAFTELVLKYVKLNMFTMTALVRKLYLYQQHCEFLRDMTVKERFQYLADKKPELINKVSQKHLASFLGVEPTYLNKIINKEKYFDHESRSGYSDN